MFLILKIKYSISTSLYISTYIIKVYSVILNCRFIKHLIFYIIHVYRYGREYADPYLGHGIGPVTGYGVRLQIINARLGVINFAVHKKSIIILL